MLYVFLGIIMGCMLVILRVIGEVVLLLVIGVFVFVNYVLFSMFDRFIVLLI